MNNLQSKLYKNYINNFKTDQKKITLQDYIKNLSWYKKNYQKLLTNIDKNCPILELGCGCGYLLYLLREMNFSKFEGIDIVKEYVDSANQYDLPASKKDVFSFLQNKTNKYGLIIAVDFIEHFSKNDADRLIKLITKALKKDGLLILQTPNGEGLFANQVIYGDLTHNTIYTSASLSQLLNAYGMMPIKFKEVFPASNFFKTIIRFIVWNICKLFCNVMRKIEAGKIQKLWTENFICVAQKTE